MSKARDIADIKSGVDVDGDITSGGSISSLGDITSVGTIGGDNLAIGGSAILDGSGNLKNIASIDATTEAAITSAGFTKTTGDITNVSAGGGLTGGGASGDVTVSHADTSSQGSVNNSGNTVIQDISVDGYGHVTSIGSTTVTIPPAGAGIIEAWVNFNGTGAVSIRASGNVSSITDIGTGNYGVNFSPSFSDTNYSAGTTGKRNVGAVRPFVISYSQTAPTTSTLYLYGHSAAAETQEDSDRVTVNVVR